MCIRDRLYFAGVLGITGSEVSAAAAATWGYPIRYGNILPIFYILSEGDTLPEGEQLLLWDELAPGNWGFLDLGSGMKTIRAVSYTHLDVYKRQSLDRPNSLMLSSTDLARLFLSCSTTNLY